MGWIENLKESWREFWNPGEQDSPPTVEEVEPEQEELEQEELEQVPPPPAPPVV